MGSIRDNIPTHGKPFKQQLKEERETRRSRAYLHAFRNGFDKDYCSSRPKRYSKAEIEEYERQLKQK
jgi:hypothetical protein